LSTWTGEKRRPREKAKGKKCARKIWRERCEGGEREGNGAEKNKREERNRRAEAAREEERRKASPTPIPTYTTVQTSTTS